MFNNNIGEILNDSFGYYKQETIIRETEQNSETEKIKNQIYEFSIHKNFPSTLLDSDQINKNRLLISSSFKNLNNSNKNLMNSINNQDFLFSGCFGKNNERGNFNGDNLLKNSNMKIKPFCEAIDENNEINAEEKPTKKEKRNIHHSKSQSTFDFISVINTKSKNETFLKPKHKIKPTNASSENLKKIMESVNISTLSSNTIIKNNSAKNLSEIRNNIAFKIEISNCNKAKKDYNSNYSDFNSNSSSQILQKKKNKLSTEELELEKIKQKQEEIKKLKNLNQKNLQKQKSVSIINFKSTIENKENRSNNIPKLKQNGPDRNVAYLKMLNKKRIPNDYDFDESSLIGIPIDNSNVSINKINTIKKSSFGNFVPNEPKSLIKSKNHKSKGVTLNSLEFDYNVDYLTKNMENSCIISNNEIQKTNNFPKLKKILDNKEVSPIRYYFEKNSHMNDHMNNIINKDKSRSISKNRTIIAQKTTKSIKKVFGENTFHHKEAEEIKSKNEDKKNSFNLMNKTENVIPKSPIIKSTINTKLVRKAKCPNIETFESIISKNKKS